MVERSLALVVVLKENGSDGFNATRERARAVEVMARRRRGSRQPGAGLGGGGIGRRRLDPVAGKLLRGSHEGGGSHGSSYSGGGAR